ncbi:amino acid permease [Paraburkholderia bryophila]|uniref:Virulence sensor protein BvgS n=1 Tax=Paraburkholderia bryophila TaxID=420952 RepID=A0A7Z0B4B9_9BURK|nr:amino acid permease [Paraburkholderia bryophila]NYH21036.1 signal transduction histidine kinase/amino acid transporter/DNA-binding NarL/FixJ family response regulator [Paraburkholderia bryophila]
MRSFLKMSPDSASPRPFRRSIGWVGTTALAMGGSNQSLFLIAALFAGQGDILGQGSAAVPLLILGLLLSYAALPGWIELVMLSPHKVGGIAAACTEAFKPYGQILSTLTGMCYWWGWVPTCGLTAILSATAINQWFLPGVPVPLMACALVCFFTAVNLLGIKWVTRLAVPIATCSAVLAFISALAPVLTGSVDWHKAVDFHLVTPFAGWFGRLTSLMAGLYLIGFAAPAFEAAACHVAETRDPQKNVPRAMKASAAMASVYFIVLPLIWLGTLGAKPLGDDLGQVLGPTFAPVFGAMAKSAAMWFMMFNMFHGTIQPLAGAARTLSQLADDGLAPRCLSWRTRTDVPLVATLATAAFAIVFLLIGDPIWLVAAANFTYLIGITLPSVAVWLMRRHAPDAVRLYRAPRYTIGLGVIAAAIWGASTVLGFQQFGLPTVVFGLAMAYSGAAVYAWRKWEDRRLAGLPGFAPTLHLRLTGAMLLVLALDGAGYILAVSKLPHNQLPLTTALEDIFVAVAMLTITVGIVLPGMIAHSAQDVSNAARKLASGTLRDFSKAMNALGRGDLNAATADINIRRVEVRSNDELGEMARSFNELQAEVASAANGLTDAREGLRSARERLTLANQSLREKVIEQQQLAQALLAAKNVAEEANAAKNQFMARMSHELRTPLNGVLGPADLLLDLNQTGHEHEMLMSIRESGAALKRVIEQILDIAQIEAGSLALQNESFELVELIERTARPHRREAEANGVSFVLDVGNTASAVVWSDPERLRQIVYNLLSNAVKFTRRGSITLSARLMAGEQGDDTLVVAVRDTGPGIAASHHERIFASFSQADESRTREHDGAGIGLFLVRELVARLGGRIELNSTPGHGATFTVSLPVVVERALPTLGQAAHAALDDGVRPVLADDATVPVDEVRGALPAAVTARILVVEDNPTNQAVALAALRRLGLAAQVAADGEEALRLYEQGQFDLILMDCHMPKMDGLQASAAIRTLERARGARAVPIVAVTADLTSANVVQCKAVGMNEVMAKPFTFAELSARVKTYIDVAAAQGAKQSATKDHEAEDAAIIDLACIEELRALADDGMPDILDDIVSTYRTNSALQIGELCRALAEGSLPRIGQIAHALKSSSAYVGAIRFSALMKELEGAATDGDRARVTPLVSDAKLAFTAVSARLGRILEEAASHVRSA